MMQILRVSLLVVTAYLKLRMVSRLYQGSRMDV